MAFFLLPCILQADPRWKIQFFYDKPDSVLQIGDLQCSSDQHCIASGLIVEKNGREKGAVVVTRDGGQHWSLQTVAERPGSLFLVNDALGWMVTEHGVWVTQDGGRSWVKQAALKGIVRVYFLNPMRGFAVGAPSAVYETVDCGKVWTKVVVEGAEPSAAKKASATKTVYDSITFSGDHGAILGNVMPREDDRPPIWLNPATARLQKQQESSNVILETFDGGKSWKSSTNLSFGDVTELLIAKAGFALALVEYHDYYSLPSSVLRVEFGNARPKVVFAKPDRAVSDIALLGDGVLLAAIQPPGNSNQVPIPGKLHIVRSSNLADWTEDEVDYRAVAQRAVLAAPDLNHAWVATDTGMILTLSNVDAPAR